MVKSCYRNNGVLVARTEIGKIGIEALVFDGFGTLFDLESASPSFDLVFPGRGREVLHWWRARQLAYTRQCVITGQYRNLWILMEQALDDASQHFHVTVSPQTRFELCSQYLKLPIFPEAQDVLTALHNRYKLILLSHGTQPMLDQVVAHNNLNPLLDAVLSVDTVQAYKPELKAYELVTQTIRLPESAFGYVGVNPMDIAGARAFGMKTIWLNRTPTKNLLMGLVSDITINNLQNLTT
jgi:2-haloacid dehalogenase